MPNRKILLVEGRDDKYVLINICASHDVPSPRIQSLGDVERLLDHIPVRLRDFNEENDVVGVVIDADTSLESRWQSIQDRLREAGYGDIPVIPHTEGTILQPPFGTHLPRVGVWIMPDNRTTGILEDFLRFLVPQQPNSLFDHVTAV